MAKLFWDDFDAALKAPVNPDNFGFNTGTHGFGANEPQAHVNHLANCHHNGLGCLQLIALKEHFEDIPPYSWSQPREYTSPRLNSWEGKKEFSFRVGMAFELKFLLPQGGKSKGMHPSCWFKSFRPDYLWYTEGEIDGFEIDMTNRVVRMTLISAQNNIEYTNATPWSPPDWAAFVKAEHVLRVEWHKATATKPETLIWLLDGVERKRVTPQTHGGTWPFTQNGYAMIISLPMGRWAGDPDGSTEFPQIMQLDHVYVDELGVPAPQPEPIPQPEEPEMPNNPPVIVPINPVETLSRTSGWRVEGATLVSNVDNQTATYEVATIAGEADLVVEAKNFPYQNLGLPEGYMFNLEVRLDGSMVGMIRILGSNDELKSGSLKTYLRAGRHEVKLRWLNDAWFAGKHDANLQLVAIAFVIQPDPAPVLSIQERAKKNLMDGKPLLEDEAEYVVARP